jgi:hypothetical protein
MVYSTQKARLNEHKDVLITLWGKNFHGLNAGRFSWIYKNNINGTPVVFLLKHEESQTFVGTLTLFQRIFCYKGQRVKAYICGDMAVNSQHRSLGPAVSLFKAAVKQCNGDSPCILLSFPNEKSEPVALRTGFKVLGEYSELVKVIRTRKYLQQHLKVRFLNNVVALLLEVLLRLRFDTFFFGNLGHYSFEVLPCFDQRFDEFWETIKCSYDFLGERDCNYLSWRVGGSPYSENRIFTLFSLKDKKIKGYIAFHLDEGRVIVDDIFCCLDRKIFQVLIFLFSRNQRMNGADSISISFAGNHTMLSGFKNRGFYFRGVISKVVAYASFGGDNFIKNINGGEWYMTSADNDI